MKRNVLKQLVCVLGIMFITFPAWSAVPSSLLPDNGSLNQTPLNDDFENDMMLAKNGGGDQGGNGGGGDNGGRGGNDDHGQGSNDNGGPNGPGDGTCDNCDGEPDQLRLREQDQLQDQLQVQEQLQVKIGDPLYLHNQAQTSAGDGGSAQ